MVIQPKATSEASTSSRKKAQQAPNAGKRLKTEKAKEDHSAPLQTNIRISRLMTAYLNEVCFMLKNLYVSMESSKVADQFLGHLQKAAIHLCL